MERQRGIRRKGRARAGTPVVALVGYTNVKSTLLNRLTGADVLVKNQLFATLDAVNRKLEFPDGDGFILVDTVGFIASGRCFSDSTEPQVSAVVYRR